MSLKDLLIRQGRHLVERDENGRIARNDDGSQRRALMPLPREQREGSAEMTWRRNLKRLTNNGGDIHERLLRIARGEMLIPATAKDPVTGETFRGEPQQPTVETQRAALKDLHEMLHGKAVAETEVSKAEEEAEKQQQLEAMSDEELRRIVDGEVVERRELPAGEAQSIAPVLDAEPRKA